MALESHVDLFDNGYCDTKMSLSDELAQGDNALINSVITNYLQKVIIFALIFCNMKLFAVLFLGSFATFVVSFASWFAADYCHTPLIPGELQVGRYSSIPGRSVKCL